jgi:hypothetical protein
VHDLQALVLVSPPSPALSDALASRDLLPGMIELWAFARKAKSAGAGALGEAVTAVLGAGQGAHRTVTMVRGAE